MTTIDALRRYFPGAFTEPPQPLMRRIDRAIMKQFPDLDQLSLSEVLGAYTSTSAYLRACVFGATRLNLDGQPQGWVNGNDAFCAAYRLEHDGQRPDSRLKNRAKKQAKREAKAAKRAADQTALKMAKPQRAASLADLRAAAQRRREGPS